MRYISAFLAVPAVIKFQNDNEPDVNRQCYDLLFIARNRISALTGIDPICPDSSEYFLQMAIIKLPKLDAVKLLVSLYRTF